MATRAPKPSVAPGVLRAAAGLLSQVPMFVWRNTPGALTAGGVLSTKFSGPHALGHLGWLGYGNHRPAHKAAA